MSIADAIRSLRDINPDAVRLAESVSFAAMIDRAFLRAARLALAPPADAGAEADLWFSALVQSRTADGIVFHPEAADALRQGMTAQQVEDVWKLTSAAHTWLAPSLELEERIAYLSVSKEPTASEDLAACLRSVLAAMVSGERAGLAQWAVRALAMFPSRVQALPEARMLETGTRMRLGDAIAAPSADQPLPSWMPWLAPSLGTVSLELELRDGELEIRTTTQDLPVKVPKTNPLILEVSWRDDSRKKHARQITFRDRTNVPVGSRELTLRTITGEEFDLHETGQGTSRLREAIVDFSREMQRHAEVEGREEEIEEVFSQSQRHQRIVIQGKFGAGKTAFLCELIRQAERRGIPAVAHFFRFGDLRMESVDAAERSLAAQIAVLFGMDERVLDLRLAEVLQRLPRQSSPRLLIVIDDVDEAHIANRALFSGGLQEMFPMLPPGVMVIGSATFPEVTTEYTLALRSQRTNPAEMELARRLATLDIAASVEDLRILFDRDPEWRTAAEVGTVALQPLPLAIMEPLEVSFTLLRSEGEDFSIVNDFARNLVIETMGVERRLAVHREFVNRLERHRNLERIERYYLTNAVWHLARAGDIDAARELAMRVEFMIAKIEMFGARALVSDFRMIEHTPRSFVVMTLLLEYGREIDESPRDLTAIMHTATMLSVDAPPSDLPLLPEILRREDANVHRPRKHDGPIRGSRLIVDADGSQTLATWSDDGTVKLWSVTSGELIDTLNVGAPVTAFAARHPYAITADAKGFLQLWNLLSPPNAVRVNAHDRAIDGMLFDATSNVIVTWAGGDPIRLWLLNQAGPTIEPLGELHGHSSAVVGCSLMAEGQLLVSASRGGTCRLWSISSKLELGSATLWGATGMAFHWDASSRFILTGKRTLDIVQVAQSSLTIGSRSIDTGHESPVTGVAVSRDGKFAATWSDDQTIRVWDVPMVSAPRHILRAHGAAITTCKFHPTSPWLISADAEGVASVWNRESGEIVSRFDHHIRAIRTIEIEGDSILTGGDDGIVLEWAAASGSLITDFSKRRGRIEQCVVMVTDDLKVLTTDGQSTFQVEAERPYLVRQPLLALSPTTAFVCGAKGGGPYVIDLSVGTPYQYVKSKTVGEICASAISTDDRLAIATMDGEIITGSISGNWMQVGKHDARIVSVAFDSNAMLIAASIDGTLFIWDLERGERLHRIDAHRSRILALAALENTAVTGSADGTLRIWDLRTGSAQTIEAAHGGPITGLWMEGNIVVSASLDRTVRVFDYKLAKELAVCRGHRDRITGVVIAMTDEVLYSCSDDRTIRQWDIETGEQKAIVYGTAPFRCISWRDGKLAAGDDAGNLWTVKERVEPKTRAEPRTRVYISHSRSDNVLAERVRFLLSPAAIQANARERIDDVVADTAQIALSNTVVVIATSEAINSQAVRQEVEEAIRAGKRIIALTSELNRFDMISRWPQLRSYTTVKVSDWKFIEGAMRDLIAAILSTDDLPE